jgi:hypothetical protein
MTIRRRPATQLAGDPMATVDGRENRRVRLWELDSKPRGTTIAKLEAVYLGALDAVDKIADHKAVAIKSKKFTADGVNADALQFAINNLVPTFKRGRIAIANARQEAAALRDKIKLQPVDKSDVVGFLQRQEIRDRLWEMSPEDRGKYLARSIDRLDPTIALAVMEMPADMSPAPETVRTLLQDRALEAQHGGAVAELQELERAIDAAESVVETGRDELRLEGGVFDPHEFDRLVAPIEAKHSAPWLKKFNENGVDVVRVMQWDEQKQTGGWSKASPEQITAGVLAGTWDEYHAITGNGKAAA